MLVLSRKLGERIALGESIVLTITALTSKHVKIGIEAPADVLVLRGELMETFGRENTSTRTRNARKECRSVVRRIPR